MKTQSYTAKRKTTHAKLAIPRRVQRDVNICISVLTQTAVDIWEVRHLVFGRQKED